MDKNGASGVLELWDCCFRGEEPGGRARGQTDTMLDVDNLGSGLVEQVARNIRIF